MQVHLEPLSTLTAAGTPGETLGPEDINHMHGGTPGSLRELRPRSF